MIFLINSMKKVRALTKEIVTIQYPIMFNLDFSNRIVSVTFDIQIQQIANLYKTDFHANHRPKLGAAKLFEFNQLKFITTHCNLWHNAAISGVKQIVTQSVHFLDVCPWR